MSRRAKALVWFTLVVAAVGTLVWTLVTGSSESSSPQATSAAIAATIRCPQCRSQSAAESAAPAAVAIRAEISRRVDAGQSRAEIQQYFVSKYGRDVLLTPEGSGVSAVVWVLPVAALVCGAAALTFALRRWRVPHVEASEADRRLVDDLLTAGRGFGEQTVGSGGADTHVAGEVDREHRAR